MRTADLQTVHTQTSAVEKSYQNRHIQGDHEQRAANELQKQAADQKMKETQATPETQESRIQLKEEKERQRRERQKKKKEEEAQAKEEENKQKRQAVTSRGIDIRI